MIRNIALAVMMLSAAVQAAEADSIVWQTRELRVAIGDDGCLQSIRSIDDATEYVGRKRDPAPIAVIYRGGVSVPAGTGKYAASTGRWIYRGGQSFPATHAAWDGQQLTVEFRGSGTTATYRVRVTSEYIAMELTDLVGEPVDRIDLFRAEVKRLPCLGQWVNVAFDDHFGICLCGATLNTLAEMDRAAEHVVLRATAEKEAGLTGATAVLFGCCHPRKRFLDVMDSIERDFDLPRGARHRRMPIQRYSYLWASRPTPANIAQYIHWAKRGGFRMLLFSYWAFSKGAGHFAWNADYPGGMADLKKVTDAVRAAGLKLGLHIHYNKAHKTDRYVTPVPDPRLHSLRRFTLAADVDPAAQMIQVKETPTGCTLDAGRGILRVGDELIAYRRYTTEPPYRFLGCQRGYHQTRPAAHKRGDAAVLLDVDTWPAFVRFDQTTDIQDEAARRIAEIYRESGPYDMIYFDGAEDVHRPFWYHVASAQYRVYRLLDPPPPVCEAAHYTHFSWHMITRSNAYDIVAPADGMKAFCRLMPCPTAAARSMDFSRVDFGWLGRFGASASGCAGPDVYEYVASRAAAWDCPISLKTSLEQIASNPRRAECFDAIRVWEEARLEGGLKPEQLEMLKTIALENAHYVPCYDQRLFWETFLKDPGNLPLALQLSVANRQEHHLFRNEKGEYELIAIDPTHTDSVERRHENNARHSTD